MFLSNTRKNICLSSNFISALSGLPSKTKWTSKHYICSYLVPVQSMASTAKKCGWHVWWRITWKRL